MGIRWKMLVGSVAGLTMWTMVNFVSAFGWTQQLQPSGELNVVIARHLQASTDARKMMNFHNKMAKHFSSYDNTDDTASCRYWAQFYKRLAIQEERAAHELLARSL